MGVPRVLEQKFMLADPNLESVMSWQCTMFDAGYPCRTTTPPSREFTLAGVQEHRETSFIPFNMSKEV